MASFTEVLLCPLLSAKSPCFRSVSLRVVRRQPTGRRAPSSRHARPTAGPQGASNLLGA